MIKIIVENLTFDVIRKKPQGRLSFLKNSTYDLKCNLNGHTINVLGVNCYNPIIAAIINIFNKLFGDIYRLDTIEELSTIDNETIFFNKCSLNKKINDAVNNLEVDEIIIIAKKTNNTGLTTLSMIKSLNEKKEQRLILKAERRTTLAERRTTSIKQHKEAIDRELYISAMISEKCNHVAHIVKLIIIDFLPKYSIKRLVIYDHIYFTIPVPIAPTPMTIRANRFKCQIELSDGRRGKIFALDEEEISILYDASEIKVIGTQTGHFSPRVSSTNDKSSDDIIKKSKIFFYEGRFSKDTSHDTFNENEQIYD